MRLAEVSWLVQAAHARSVKMRLWIMSGLRERLKAKVAWSRCERASAGNDGNVGRPSSWKTNKNIQDMCFTTSLARGSLS